MDVFRAAWKLWRVLLHAIAGLCTIWFRFPRLDAAQRQAEVQSWARRMLERLDVGLELRGQPPVAGPMLLVANHISWLDILVMHAARYCRFVSKADVRGWPLFGALATGGGTLYIERASRRDALRVVHHMADSLRQGDVVAVFPEGTTSDGLQLLPFHANLIQAAISADAQAQPVALRFVNAATGEVTQTASYIGDETLVGSIWRTLCGARITAIVSFGMPEFAAGRDRRGWAADLRARVEALRN